MTKWERKELGIQSRIAQTRLKQELKVLNEPTASGYSRAQMGSLRVKEIEAQIKRLKQIESKKGYEFKNLKNRIQNIGTSDYSMRKAITYRENYFSMIEKAYKNFDNYDKLVNKLETFKNPLSFYEFLSQNELLADITYMYDMGTEGIAGVSDQDKFNYLLESIGIDTSVNESLVTSGKNQFTSLETKYKYRLEVNGNPVSYANDKSILNKQALDLKGNIRVIEN